MATNFGVSGRLVWGHPGEEQPVVDTKTKQPRISAKTGKPRVSWTFGLAVSIDDFNNICWPKMYQEAASIFGPNVNQNPKFAWKYKRDTDLDSKGQPYSTHEGRAGVITLTISTEAFAPPLFKMGANGIYQQIEGKEMKCGDFVYVNVNCVGQKPDNATDTPSVYLNPDAVLLIGYGTEIISRAAVDPKQAFAGFSGQLPPGATMQPTAPANVGQMPTPGFAGQQPIPTHGVPMATGGHLMPGVMPGQMPPGVPGAAPHAGPIHTGGMPTATTAYPSNIQPAHDFVNAVAGPSAYGQPAPSAPMPGAMPGQMPGYPTAR